MLFFRKIMCAAHSNMPFKNDRFVFFVRSLMLVAALSQNYAYGASLDCAKASTPAEKMICSSDELSRLDSELNTIYRKAIETTSKDPAEIKRSQIEWLSTERNNCVDPVSMKIAYEKRIRELKASTVDRQQQHGMPEFITHYHFQLTHGVGKPVCDAYQQRLNAAAYTVPPYCDRPANSNIAGFTTLHRVYLGADEVNLLLPKVNSLMLGGKTIGSESLQFINEEMQRTDIKVWRYVPPVDVDNDGIPDNVLIWQGYGAGFNTNVCGTQLGETDYDRQAQVAYILADDNESINVHQTRTIFGHPSGGYHLSDGSISAEFRPIGQDIDIFEYKGLYYFDTFFDDWGDFAGKRRKDPEIMNTLGVFLRRNGETKQVCEYRMTEN